MGRRTILNDHSNELIKLVRSGASFEDACASRGISESTLYQWLRKGNEQKSGQYVEFMKEIRKAEIDAKIRKIMLIEKECVEDARLALEVLARKYPKEWGRKQNIELDADITNSGVTLVYVPESAKDL